MAFETNAKSVQVVGVLFDPLLGQMTIRFSSRRGNRMKIARGWVGRGVGQNIQFRLSSGARYI